MTFWQGRAATSWPWTINELAYYVQSLHKASMPRLGPSRFMSFENKVCRDAPRFRGYELPVYPRRIAAAGARLCGSAGGPLRHHPRAMGGAGEGRTLRGHEADRTCRADGDAADHADAFDRSPLRQRLD